MVTLELARVSAVPLYRAWLTQVGVAISHPLAFFVVGTYVAAWLLFDRHSFGWQSAATIAVCVGAGAVACVQRSMAARAARPKPLRPSSLL